jgi:hypothetical protein
MISCKDISAKASRYHDGDCGWPERLSICVDCRRYLAQFAATIGLLGALPPDPPDEAMVADLLRHFGGSSTTLRAVPLPRSAGEDNPHPR